MRTMPLAATAVLAVSALTLSGCSLTPGASTGQQSTGPVSTALPSGHVTLTLAMSTGPDMASELIAAYEHLHPNVTIKRQYTSFSDYKQNIKLNLSSDKAPDIAQFNAGAMQSLIPAGLLVNLDPYAKAYHWSDQFPADGLEQVTAEKNGKTFGKGSLYAVPAGMSVTGVFYNKSLMKKAGVTRQPATLDEFASDLAKAKAAGQTPLSVGALDNGALHLWAAVLGKEMSGKQYRQWVYGQPGGDITTAAPKAATDRIAKWAKQGYIPDWANGTGQVDAAARFTEGQTTYLVSGSWAAVDIAKGLGDKAGFFLLPPTQAEGPAVANGSSVAYAVSSKSKHPEVAANFLNFLSSPTAAKIVAKGGFMPVNTQSIPKQSGLLGDLSGGYQQVVKDNGLLQFPDAASPDMLPILQSGLQSVIIQRKSTKDFLTSLQDAWSHSHGK